MGTCDSEGACELVGIFLLWKLEHLTVLDDVELYCDDVLMVIRKKSPREVEKNKGGPTYFFKDYVSFKINS